MPYYYRKWNGYRFDLYLICIQWKTYVKSCYVGLKTAEREFISMTGNGMDIDLICIWSILIGKHMLKVVKLD